MKFLIFIWNIFKRYHNLLIINIALTVFLSLLDVCSLFSVGPLIDFLINPSLQNPSPLTHRILAIIYSIGLPVTLKGYLCIFVALIILSSGFRIFVRYSILKIKYTVMRDLILGTFEDFFNARWHFFSGSRHGVLLNTFMGELSVVGDAFGAIGIFFATFIQLIFCLAVPFYISWQVTLLSLLMALFFVWPFVLFGKISYRLGKLNTSTANRIVTAVQESLELAKIILGFGNKDKSYNELKSAFEAHTQATVKSQTLTNAIPELYQPFGVIVLIVALLAAGKFSISLSAMAVLLLALLRVVFSIGSLISYRHSLENFFPSYEQIDDFRNKAKELKQYSGNRVFIGFKREIAIEDVTFAYLGHNPALIKVNMKIPKGKMIAVVGESGAGKSTLIDIIMGFNEPMKGRVLFDGVDLREFDINSYRRRIGYVPQDSILFNMSIRDNLLWSKEDATSQDIKYSCRLASADEFIERLPNAYDTLVGDRGVRLSGGQRQRIALARAILRQPELLFLDEATSSLDTQSEKLIQQAIENIVRETTIIVIAHRLSTIVNADYVYVLKEGGVIEEGTYLDLVKRDCHFNRMVKLQLLKVA